MKNPASEDAAYSNPHLRMTISTGDACPSARMRQSIFQWSLFALSASLAAVRKKEGLVNQQNVAAQNALNAGMENAPQDAQSEKPKKRESIPTELEAAQKLLKLSQDQQNNQ